MGCGSLKVKLYFDVRVVDTDAQSYISRSVADALVSAEEEKKQKYRLATEARHASFSPFVVSVDGALGKKADLFSGRSLIGSLSPGVEAMVMFLDGLRLILVLQ